MLLERFPLFHRGKVSDLYELDTEHLLFVTSNRVSAYDVVFDAEIPGKGEVLTAISARMFRETAHLVPNHFVALGIERPDLGLPPEIARRTMVVRRAERIPVECVARSHLAGSALEEYKATGMVAGIPLRAGLRGNDMLPQPIFTPARKADTGHDQNMTFAEIEAFVGMDIARELKSATLLVYSFARFYGARCHLTFLDFKIEFGWIHGVLSLIDKLGTPDESRYFPTYDKQFLRDWLDDSGWDRTPPAPPLPRQVIDELATRYRTAQYVLTEIEYCP